MLQSILQLGFGANPNGGKFYVFFYVVLYFVGLKGAQVGRPEIKSSHVHTPVQAPAMGAKSLDYCPTRETVNV